MTLPLRVTVLARDELIAIELGTDELEDERIDEIVNELLATAATEEGTLLLAGTRFQPPSPPPPPQANSNIHEHKNSTRRLHRHTGKTINDPISHRIWLNPE